MGRGSGTVPAIGGRRNGGPGGGRFCGGIALFILALVTGANGQPAPPLKMRSSAGLEGRRNRWREGLSDLRRTIDDVVGVERIVHIELSPNGRWAYVVTERSDAQENVRRARSYVIDVLGEKPPLGVPSDIMGAVWLPNSQALSYVRRENGCIRLWLFDPRSGRRRRIWRTCLSGKEPPLRMRWSPDGRYLAYIVRDESSGSQRLGLDTLDHARNGIDVGALWIWGCEVASPALRAYAPLLNRPARGGELWLIEWATGRHWRASQEQLDVRDASWAPDGRRLTFVGFASRDSSPSFTEADVENPYGGIVAVNTVALERSHSDVVAVLGHHPGNVYMTVDWAPHTDRIAVGLSTVTEVRLYDLGLGSLETSERSPPNAVVTPRVTITGQLVGPIWWSSNGRLLNGSIRSGLRQSVYRIDVELGVTRDIFPDLNWYGVPTVAGDRRTAAMTVESVTEPPQVVLASFDTGASLQAIHPVSIPRVRRWHRLDGTVDTLSWASTDAKWTIHAILVTPAAPRPGRGWPLVVAFSGGAGGPHLEYGVNPDYIPVLPLVARGYAVLIPSSRGRLGYGAAFFHAREDERTYFVKPWVNDIVPGVDVVVGRGIADSSRLGIMGYSYDGGLAAYGITRTRRFKAAVLKEAAGIDMRAGPRIYWGVPFLRAIGKLALPEVQSPYDSASLAWLDMESPITHVADVRTPALLEFGVKNINAVLDGNPFFQALQYLKVPSRYVVYPRTGHAFEEPALIADSLRREVEWFDEWLRGSEGGFDGA